MELNEYQKKARETADYPKEYHIIYPALGVAGEAGEVAEKIKKVLRDNNGRFTQSVIPNIIKELGDVLWYVAILAEDLGYTLNDVAQLNIDKLADRKNRDMIHGSGDFR